MRTVTNKGKKYAKEPFKFVLSNYKPILKYITYWCFYEDKDKNFAGFVQSKKYSYKMFRGINGIKDYVDITSYDRAHKNADNSLKQQLRIFEKQGYTKSSKTFERGW